MNKKITALIAALLIVAIASISASLAYFTDTDAIKNEFTVGDVEIDLTEGAWVRDTDPESTTYGDIIAKGDGSRLYEGEGYDEGEIVHVNDYGKLYPGMTVYKDPIIENTGSENAYVGAKIIITDGDGDLLKIIGSDVAPGFINLTGFVTGGICGVEGMTYDRNNTLGLGANVHYTDDAIIKQVPLGNGVWEIYVFAKAPLGGTDDTLGLAKSVTLFTQLNVDAKWDQAEMANLKDLDIIVEAYATQTNGFNNVVDALTAAFWTDLASK